MSDETRRHTVASEAALIVDPQARAEAEVRNGLRQFDLACQMIMDALEKGAGWKLRVSALLSLHREALDGIGAHAGLFRPADVAIEGSKHEPAGAHRVPELVEDLCDYINNNWQSSTAVHLASYVMWRLNWIHPFTDGNGRTSRMVSYLVLCIKLQLLLPGRDTIPEQIVRNRRPYFEALEAADQSAGNGKPDLSKMEVLIEAMLARQLASVMQIATGKNVPDD